jgi:hypothetical protein
MRLASAVALLALSSACAPDPVLGTFSFTMTGTDTNTAPNTSSSAASGSGHIAITTGKQERSFVVTLAQADTVPCVLNGAAESNTPGRLSLPGGQTCTFGYSGGTVTATTTSGSITVDDKDAFTMTVSYSYTGTTLIGITFAGNGSRTYTGTRR